MWSDKCSALILSHTFLFLTRWTGKLCRTLHLFSIIIYLLMVKRPNLWSHFNFCSTFIKARSRISVSSLGLSFYLTLWTQDWCFIHRQALDLLLLILLAVTVLNRFIHLTHTHAHSWFHCLSASNHISLSLSLSLLLSSSPTPLLPTVNWSRSWTRRAVAASCCHGRVASTSAAASAAARPSSSYSTPSASAGTAATTSARPAGSTTSGRKPGCAPPARRAGKAVRGVWECICVFGQECVFVSCTRRLS